MPALTARRVTIMLALCVMGIMAAHRPAAAGGEGPLADPRVFPIGVWLQSPTRARAYKDIGVNLYVGLWEGPTEAQLADLAGLGMPVIAEQNPVALGSANNPMIKAWLQPDEPDNAQAGVLRRYGPCVPAAEVAQRTAAIKARDPSRPVMINFGRGVADPSWIGRGSCTGDDAWYDRAIEGAGILSFDIYPVGSDTPGVKGHLEFVARGVANLVARARPTQQVWAVLETTALDPARPPAPAEVRAEVWLAVTHGAKGIVYFAHEWVSGFREDGIFRHPEIVAEVTSINRTLTSLAPVLNSAAPAIRVDVTSPVPIATLAKRWEDAVYVFAVSMRNSTSRPRLAVHELGDASAEVLNENRRIAIRKGVIDDEFDGYAVHLYRIPMPAGAQGRPK